jgi:hypothetical protein
MAGGAERDESERWAAAAVLSMLHADLDMKRRIVNVITSTPDITAQQWQVTHPSHPTQSAQRWERTRGLGIRVRTTPTCSVVAKRCRCVLTRGALKP